MRFLVLILLIPSWAFASATRVQVMDQAYNSSGTNWNMPNGPNSTLVSQGSTDTLTNKTISGATNTLSQLPVSSQYVVDTFFGNGSSTILTLSFGTPSASGLVCYSDGLALDPTTDYTYTGGTTSVTLTTAAATGQRIKCVYSKY